MDENRQIVILIVDDDEVIRDVTKEILLEELDCRVVEATNGLEGIEMVDRYLPDLILLDIEMPQQDGFTVAKIVRGDPRSWDIPIIFMTGLIDQSTILRTFEVGGNDYISKPASPRVLLARIRSHLERKRMSDELHLKNRLLMDRELHLSTLLTEKTKEIRLVTLAMIEALENANHLNDEDTGLHLRRVGHYSALLAREYGCDQKFVSDIELYASLHDVGKVGIPDHILKKPGPLTSSEFSLVEKHVVLGHQMIDQPAVDQMAKNIVLYHHERWDGNGYVHKLAGEEIPLEARIVTVADVYDALSFQRVYKPSFPEVEIEKYMKSASGLHFEPALVDIFFNHHDKFLEIKAHTS
ncbi:MAG: response regulator [Candidatus Cloacimonetes bacterium]|nr:response regulator [Candidatus Cloacimonadota bacterium]